MMNRLIWLLGLIIIVALAVLNIVYDIPMLLRLLNPLLLASFLCLYRIWRGPTAADRAVAIDILGILIVGFCGILAIFTKRSFFIDIAIAWALQSFIATLALAKFLEKRGFDE